MTNIIAHSSAPCGPRRVGLVARLISAFGLANQRHALAQLDDARLKDIGITRAQALDEARRPLWDVPKTWKF